MTLITNVDECDAAMAEVSALLDERPSLHSAKGRRLISLSRGVKDWLLDDSMHPDEPDPRARRVTLALWGEVEKMLAQLQRLH